MTTAAASMQSNVSDWGILARLFPRQIDNDYRGSSLAIWLMVPLVLMRMVMGVNSIIITHAVASGIDGIPLASYHPAASETVVAMFALLGLAMVLVALQGVVALIRYRAMIPMFYLLMLAGVLGAKAVALLHPIASSSPSPLAAGIGLILPTMMVVGFGLSLSDPSPRKTSEGAR